MIPNSTLSVKVSKLFPLDNQLFSSGFEAHSLDPLVTDHHYGTSGSCRDHTCTQALLEEGQSFLFPQISQCSSQSVSCL